MTVLADPPVVACEPEVPAPLARGPQQRWWKGWRVPLRLARRDLRRRPGRTVLVALLVAVPVTVLVLMDVSYRTTQAEQGAWVPKVFGDSDALASVSSECDGCPLRADIDAALPSGTRAVWATQAGVPLRTPRQAQSRGFTVANVDATDPLFAGSYLLAGGRWPTGDDEVALRSDLAEFLGVSLGDAFSLAHQTRRFRVVGLMDVGGWQASSMVAPGFDFGVVRPSSISEVAALDLPDSFDAQGWLASSIGSAVQLRPGRNGTPAYSVGQETSVDQSLILGWLGGVLAMSVLGVVVAAAFAISGRRQLVAVGQLSASGAGRRTLVRTFGLFGGLTGVVGSAIGLLAAVGVHWKWPQLFGAHGPAVVAWLDIALVTTTAVGVATVAALAPTHSLTQLSVLSALAGRRPVGVVPTWLVRSGAALLGGGLLVTLIATRSGANGGGKEAGMLVALGMIAAVLGICALAPWLVDRLASVASRRGGSVRLAARSMARHRPRAAAVLASLLLVGMAATGVAAFVEHNLQQDAADRALTPFTRGDLLWVQSTSAGSDANSVWFSIPRPLVDVPSLRAHAEAVVGKVQWSSASLAYRPATTNPETEAGLFAIVASDPLFDLFGFSEQQRSTVAGSTVPLQFTRRAYPRDGSVPSVDARELLLDLPWLVIGESAAAADGWVVVSGAVELGVAEQSLTFEEAQALLDLSVSNDEGLAYNDMVEEGRYTSWSLAIVANAGSFRLTPAQARAMVLGASLLVVILLISIGMALWAVEGRDERDVLVAVGASPSTMARIAGWRAGGLTFCAMVIAVPMGLLVSWALARAANGDIAVPWLLASLLLVAVPAFIGIGAWACSAVAQRVRPVRMSTLTAD